MTDKATFETLNFDNLALKTLPIDSVSENYVRLVKGACFSKVSGALFALSWFEFFFICSLFGGLKVSPTPCDNPRMVVFSEAAMELVDLDQTELEVNENEGAQ